MQVLQERSRAAPAQNDPRLREITYKHPCDRKPFPGTRVDVDAASLGVGGRRGFLELKVAELGPMPIRRRGERFGIIYNRRFVYRASLNEHRSGRLRLSHAYSPNADPGTDFEL